LQNRVYLQYGLSATVNIDKIIKVTSASSHVYDDDDDVGKLLA